MISSDHADPFRQTHIANEPVTRGPTWWNGPIGGCGSVGGLNVTNVSAHVALNKLRDGNQRFVSGNTKRSTALDQMRRNETIAEQKPYAIVLGCSDSRVPSEIIFDQGLGDLFVVRVAGNIAADSQVGSVEFAAERFGTRLVVVLGHSECGAVAAALEQAEFPTHSRSPYLDAIIDHLRPTVRALLKHDSQPSPDELTKLAVRANIRTSVNHLTFGSEILAELIEKDGLVIVGAEYSLRTGAVQFLDSRQEVGGRYVRLAVDNA